MEVDVMSQTLIVELSDEVYAAIQRYAVETNTSAAHIAATSLEQHFRQEPRPVRNILVQAELTAAHPEPLTNARPLTNDQRKALAQQVAHGRPLSEYIHEERGER
jgi:hypothetical protein